MTEILNRQNYLQKLINRMHNGEVKIITGSPFLFQSLSKIEQNLLMNF